MKCDLIFLALSRNCERTIPIFVQWMSALGQHHGLKCHALVGENASEDGTLDELARVPELITPLNTAFMSRIAGRLERMAIGRQFLADHLAHSGIEARTVAIVDLDDPMSVPPDPAHIARCIQEIHDGEYFAISASSFPFYYDLLAFEGMDSSYLDLDRRIKTAQRNINPMSYYRLFRDEIYPAQRRLTGDQAIPAISAFNGMCLYRRSDFERGHYTSDADFGLCEHVNFNRSLHARTGKLMKVDPQLKVAMPYEHGPLNGWKFAMQRLNKVVSRAMG